MKILLEILLAIKIVEVEIWLSKFEFLCNIFALLKEIEYKSICTKSEISEHFTWLCNQLFQTINSLSCWLMIQQSTFFMNNLLDD